MRRALRMTLLLLVGAGLLRVALFTDLYLRYVKQGMRPLLIASGALLVLLAAAEAVSGARRREDDGHGDDEEQEHGHGHHASGTPWAAWLLLPPALSLLLWAPPALGAYTAARQPAQPVTRASDFDPLPATSPLPLTLSDFTRRVRQDDTQAIKGRVVRLTGFVTPGGRDGDWSLNRIIISCCAADARTVKVRVRSPHTPAADTWVTVTGTWRPGGTLGTASAPVALEARSVRKVAKPVNAYTDALLPAPSG
ncbi:TIGR03943 family putative permease subunit [Streptomyces griseoaurantiacus]|nr:TIGR03943 family protein [Streptomyces jietaisiensis]